MDKRKAFGLLGIILCLGVPIASVAWAMLTASFSDTRWVTPEVDTNGVYWGSTPAPTDDHTGNGIKANVTAGENIVPGSILYLKSDGKYWRSDADAATTMPIVAVSLTTTAADGTATVLLSGYFRDDTYTWTTGQILYGSTGVGTITATAPIGSGDQVQVVGIAISGDVVLFNPNYMLIELT